MEGTVELENLEVLKLEKNQEAIAIEQRVATRTRKNRYHKFRNRKRERETTKSKLKLCLQRSLC